MKTFNKDARGTDEQNGKKCINYLTEILKYVILI